MPKMTDHMESGEIVGWLAQEGDQVEVGQAILEIMTDKVVAEVESPASGVLKGIRPGVIEGTNVPVGVTFAFIAQAEEEVPALAPLGANAPTPVDDAAISALSLDGDEAELGPVRAVPAARRVARELRVDLANVPGSGPGGRISEQDVRAFAQAPGRYARPDLDRTAGAAASIRTERATPDTGTRDTASRDRDAISLTPARKRELLRQMYAIRAFEEMAEQLYALGKIHGTMHLSIGMEASAVGAIAALRPDDLILSTHRGHGHCIAKGADIERMMAEFMGKETGYCRGRGGSMHIADVQGGNLGANGVVGGGIPMAMGVALGLKLQGRDQVILCFFGDGAANLGPFHESLNMAAIWDLPVVYVCENNQYAMSCSVKRAFAIDRISDRAAAYGMPGVTIDGNDVIAVYETVSEAVDRARSGNGPTLVENLTYRWRGHSKSDANVYRTREEIEAWMARGPIRRFRKLLVDEGTLSEDQTDVVEREAYRQIEAAVAFAEASPEPDLATIEEGVYA